ncbi:hypothetical protein LAD77_00730 [Klebsiella pneumoniae]|nr:hypothetical protein [Klebsiella pneumoniae]
MPDIAGIQPKLLAPTEPFNRAGKSLLHAWHLKTAQMAPRLAGLDDLTLALAAN